MHQIKVHVSNNQSNRYIYIELMRILAVFCVIFNHTSSKGFFLFAHRSINSIAFWIYMVPSIVCRISVPLFLMISGALMLGREDASLKDLWKNKILKMVYILVVWSLVYYICDIVQSSEPFRFQLFIKQLYSYHIKFHLWYLYIYIAYLISLPFLRSMVQKLETKYFYYMIGIALFFNGILLIEEYLLTKGAVTINSDLKVSWLISDVVLYPCMGYFLQYRVDYSKIKKKLPFLWGASFAGIVLCCFMTFYKSQVTNTLVESESQTFHQSFAVIYCVTIFVSIKLLSQGKRFSNRIKAFILSLGKATFGIYLMHWLVMNSELMNRFLNVLLVTGLNDMICIWIYCLTIMIICFGITVAIAKLPIVKRLVGY